MRRCGAFWGLGCVLLVTVAPAAAQPTVPTLAGGAPTVEAESAPARALPARVTVCIDRAARRCWSAPGVDACSGGEVYAVTAADEQPGVLLERCARRAR